ncbi:MAG: antibiotic biosynthesis monooxygenase [Deltaproteobacteria bacterium]|jgi:heme-degrading monooxygenase HmoA|nr:antibiotic biosynthesis monooxygenase [Deltaproteobacteria bacterium]
MAVKIILKRKVTKDKEASLLPLLIEMRTLATSQPGYISGETWRNMDQPDEVLVISTWQSAESWKAWLTSPQRAGIQEKIDALLEAKTEYSIYYYG